MTKRVFANAEERLQETRKRKAEWMRKKRQEDEAYRLKEREYDRKRYMKKKQEKGAIKNET